MEQPEALDSMVVVDQRPPYNIVGLNTDNQDGWILVCSVRYLEVEEENLVA